MDIIHTLSKFFDHNRWTVIAPSAASLLFIPGCFDSMDRRATSPVSGEQVNLSELEKEVLTEQGALQSKYAELERAIQALILEQNQVVRDSEKLAEGTEFAIGQIEQEQKNLDDFLGGTIQVIKDTFPASSLYLGPLSGVLGAFGVGATIDNRRKDRLIKKLDKKNPAG